jgi:hypothetical protein
METSKFAVHLFLLLTLSYVGDGRRLSITDSPSFCSRLGIFDRVDRFYLLQPISVRLQLANARSNLSLFKDKVQISLGTVSSVITI